MPGNSRSRSNAASPAATGPDQPQPTQAPTQDPPHTRPTSKIVKGTLATDPDGRFAANGKLVAGLRVTEANGQRTWNAKLWQQDNEQADASRAGKANEELRRGDTVTVIGTWTADRTYKRRDGEDATATHELSVKDILVNWGDKAIPLDKFDRAELEAQGIDPTPTAPADLGASAGQSTADAGGMSAAD
jgi:hypothetical protein